MLRNKMNKPKCAYVVEGKVSLYIVGAEDKEDAEQIFREEIEQVIEDTGTSLMFEEEIKTEEVEDSETSRILADKPLRKALENARKHGSKSSPYEPLV